MRPIDADALKEYIGGVRAEYNFFDDNERPRYEAHSKAIYLLDLYLDNAPTIDAVSVVRCKECKWEQRCQKAVQHTTHELTSVTIGYKAVEFCSYGEREGE